MKKIAVLLAGSFVATAVFAQGGALDAIKNRQNAMKALGATMGVLGPIAKGDVEPEEKLMAGQAAILNTVMVVLNQSFPEGSLDDTSEASDKIWSDPEGWNEKLGALDTAVAAFTEGSMNKDTEAMKLAIGEIGKTCKACHSEYRIESF